MYQRGPKMYAHFNVKSIALTTAYCRLFQKELYNFENLI
jgi:hypothetical protein